MSVSDAVSLLDRLYPGSIISGMPGLTDEWSEDLLVECILLVVFHLIFEVVSMQACPCDWRICSHCSIPSMPSVGSTWLAVRIPVSKRIFREIHRLNRYAQYVFAALSKSATQRRRTHAIISIISSLSMPMSVILIAGHLKNNPGGQVLDQE